MLRKGIVASGGPASNFREGGQEVDDVLGRDQQVADRALLTRSVDQPAPEVG
jgi:hypothetical protein